MRHEYKLPSERLLSIAGLGFSLLLFLLGCSYFYFIYYTVPQVPALQSSYIHLHVPLGIIALASAITSLGMTIYCIARHRSFPKVVFLLQWITTISFFANIIVGTFWANYAWGTYWNWDPKETWSLITFIFFIGPTTLVLRFLAFNWLRFLFLILQLAGMIFVLTIDLWIAGLHSYGSILLGE